MPDVLLVSGSGPYADAWHSFPATSARIAGIIRALGLSVEITEDVEGGLAQPGASRLLVVNIGNPPTSVRLSSSGPPAPESRITWPAAAPSSASTPAQHH
jgi:hypothetical protein